MYRRIVWLISAFLAFLHLELKIYSVSKKVKTLRSHLRLKVHVSARVNSTTTSGPTVLKLEASGSITAPREGSLPDLSSVFSKLPEDVIRSQPFVVS